ncbi:hypothetical protein HaLaN_29992 [Haematococcus lacustris]|uniref:Uncharacterized protein n=1 Tax=Haematococcus lacustris TaxID=44745 RepID=A0A6A0AGP3_HAELA|nr:hypothetical protein HaLaN_29992 [Haematococcus lacustris]
MPSCTTCNILNDSQRTTGQCSCFDALHSIVYVTNYRCINLACLYGAHTPASACLYDHTKTSIQTRDSEQHSGQRSPPPAIDKWKVGIHRVLMGMCTVGMGHGSTHGHRQAG